MQYGRLPMETPYSLNFEKGVRRQDVKLENLPEWCEYPLTFADHRESFVLTEIELLSQQLKHEPFFIDLIQLRVNEPIYIPFEIKKRQLFLYFILKGTLLYMTEKYSPIIRTQANNFLMSYYDTGGYFSYAEEGMHIVLIVSIHPEWMESMFGHYPNLQNILHRFKYNTSSYDTMHQCHMDRKIHRWLYKIYSYSQNNMGVLDGTLRKYISFLLEHYDSVLEDQKSDLAYKIKTYIQEHYCENELNVKFLTEFFFLTERTLLNVFKRQYEMSVQQFITELRISRALLLMEQQGMGIKDVYTEVGYSDERSFRYALERYQKGT